MGKIDELTNEASAMQKPVSDIAERGGSGAIAQLILQYCPDGMEYVSIGSLITRVRDKGKNNPSVKTVYSVSNTLGLVKAEDFRDNVIYSEDTSNYVVVEQGMFAYNPARLNIGSLAYLQNNQPGLVSPMYVVFGIDKSKILPEYLYLYLKSPYIIGKINSLTESGARFRFDFERWGLIEIPLPPLPVQETIVNILDRFTVYAAELQAELQARQQQYNYYRDTLLSFEGREDVQWKKLGEVASIKTGRRFVRTDIRESGVPCFHYGDIYTYYGLTATKTKGYLDAELASKLRFAQPNDVVVVCAGENDMDIGVGVAWLGDEPAVIHDACCILHHEQNPRYISHFLRTHNYHLQMKRYVKNGKISSLPASGLAEALIPIPSLEEQEKIANILDRFDHLTNDLSQGLPAEIEARRQQYEYYRDKLLTFKRK